MAKKIDRSRIEAGRAELPKKLGFLSTEKVDYLSITDRDGSWSVELSAAALAKLVKAKGELKSLKGEQKKVAADHGQALGAEQDAHEATRQALAKAERRVKALEKKLAAPSEGAAGSSKGTTNKPVGKARKAAAVDTTKGNGAQADATGNSASNAGEMANG